MIHGTGGVAISSGEKFIISNLYMHGQNYSDITYSGFQNPNVTVTCSNGPTNNTVNVTWSPVHKNYDSVEKIMKYEEFQFCKIELNCENGFKKVNMYYVPCIPICLSHFLQYSIGP